LAIFQAFAMYGILNSQKIIINQSPLIIIALVASMLAGTMIMIFFGQLINEYGIGNGISVLIFAGIISRLPVSAIQSFVLADWSNPQTLFNIIVFAALIFAIVLAVVTVEEAVYRIPVSYAKRGQNTYLPIKVNVSGVMPIIFAVSLVSLPSLLGQALARSSQSTLAAISRFLIQNFNSNSVLYLIVYFLLVIVFTFFYSTVVFKPKDVAEELRKSGGYIPGIRPGSATEKRLTFILYRVVFIGAFFLALIAVLPAIIQKITGLSSLTIGGTSVLIVVSVILELHRKIENVVQMYNYDKLTY